MKTIHCLTAMLLIGSMTFAFALTSKEEERRRAIETEMQKNEFKGRHRARSNSNLNHAMIFVGGPREGFGGLREDFGISKEQAEKIQNVRSYTYVSTVMQNDPDYKAIQEKINELLPDVHNASEETLKLLFDLAAKKAEMEERKIDSLIKEHLTPDQMKKVREFQIFITSEEPVVAAGMFEALDLSDAQREQLNAITKDMEPELEEYADMQAEMGMFDVRPPRKIQEALASLDVSDPEERKKLANDIKNTGRNELTLEMYKFSKGVNDKLKIRMFDVLTDEQWNRMLNLIDNPPLDSDYGKNFIVAIRAHRQRIENAGSSTGVYRPGPNSWRPGDPVPEQYRQERNERSRFSRENAR